MRAGAKHHPQARSPRALFLLMWVMVLWTGSSARAEYLPYPLAPVDLPILNIPQQTDIWCWAAVAQQIISATIGPSRTPNQCALVAAANNMHPQSCCGQGHPACYRAGSIPEIQQLIGYFGGRYSNYAMPAHPMTLYRTLAAGHAIILQLRPAGQTIGHVVVLRGMSSMPTPYGHLPVLHINDPMALYTQPVPFDQIQPIWQSAIVVH